MMVVIIGLAIIVFNIICSFSLIFIERKEPTTTWAWLLIMLLLPGVGFLIYLLLGQNLSRERLFKAKKIIDKNKRLEICKEWEKTSKNSHSSNAYFDLIKMNFNHSGAKYTTNNKVKTYYNGQDKFKDLITDLRNAKKFINIEYYIFRNDKIGKQFSNILEQKAKEGVEVRFLVDSMGSYKLTKRSLKKYLINGGKFAIFFPGILPHINTRINYRNHRKIVVIDGLYGYTGGFNVGDEYLGKDKSIGYWRDTNIRIEGEAVNDLTDRFLLDWCYAAKEDIEDLEVYHNKVHETKGDIGIQIVTSGPDHNEEYIKNSYLKMINNAKKNVYLETPYLVPDASMGEALKISALSGVDVRIIIPGKPDHFFMEWAASAYIEELLEAGVKVYKYNNGFIHAKTIAADSQVSTVGTANMDMRSFSLNFEVNAFIYDDRVTKNLEEQFLKDIEDCYIVKYEEFLNRGKIIKIKESLIRLIAPIL